MNKPFPSLPSAATDSPVTAIREEALNQITRTVTGLAFVSLLIIMAARPEDILSVAALLAAFTVLAAVLGFGAQDMAFRLRAVLFILLFYASGIGSLLILGIGGSGAMFLLAFAVLTMIFFGTLPGISATVLAVLTWLGAGVLFSQYDFHSVLSPSSATFTDWISGSTTLLIVIISLLLPQRQFLSSQEFVVSTSKEKRDLQETRLALEKQTQQLEM